VEGNNGEVKKNGKKEGDEKKITVLHLSWEYPPHKVGGLGTHVQNLSKAEVKANIQPIVLTCGFNGNCGISLEDGVLVYRVDADGIPAEDFFSWTLQMNILLQAASAEIFSKYKIDLIHAHDWLVTTTAVALKHIYRIPLVATIHALESGRYGGIKGDRQMMIHDLEGKLVFEAWRVICCSNFMKYSVVGTFCCPEDKVDVIPNGVNVSDFEFDYNKDEFKRKYAMPEEKIVLFVGRHVWEKGLDVLIGAIPMILEKHPEAKFVITGDGYLRGQCESLANQIAPQGKVLFTGYLPDKELKMLMKTADVMVIPSRYEPFGIVALEGLAAKTPIVVADTGGLGEIVRHEENGIKIWVDNSESLAWGVNYILDNPERAKQIVENGYKEVKEKYSWLSIAKQTRQVYERILAEYSRVNWKPRFNFWEKRNGVSELGIKE